MTALFKAFAALVALFATLAVADTASAVPTQAGKAATLRVMPLGDSITRGQGDGGATGTYNGYRCSLKNRLTSAGIAIDYVGPLSEGRSDCADREHAGWSGWTIAELTASAAGWVTTYQPDVVLLMAGTNDVIERADMPNMGARLGQLIDTVKAAKPGVIVIVSTLPQLGTSNWCCDAAQVAAWNTYKAAVPQVATQHGAFTAYNDRVYKSELVDGIHPKACAYGSKMAFDWYFAWVQAVPSATGRTPDPLWAPATC
jgi:lysophospholipase L1-like esterase